MNATSDKNDRLIDPAHYMCVWCDNEFIPDGPQLCCPECGTDDRKDLIPIYIGNDEQLQGMYCAIDFHGG